MKIKKIFNVILCCILLITSIPISVTAEELTIIEHELSTSEYIPGEIVITTSDEIVDSSSTFTTCDTDTNCTLINFNKEEINDIEEIITYKDESEEKVYVIDVEGDIFEKCKELEKIPGVVCAEPNYLLDTMGFTMPNEITQGTLYSTHMKWYFDSMKITEAWQEYEVTGNGVVVAVIDNGFKIDAVEFPKNLWTDSNGNHGWNTHKNSPDISPIYQNDGTEYINTGHGTHVAGIIGAPANNGNIIGAAYGAQLMLINAAHYNADTNKIQFTIDDITKAIYYAIENQADIINLSLGIDAESIQLENAVNDAYEAGIAVIASAGNDGISTTVKKYYPAAYESVIGVMAIDKDNPTQLAFFSNYDPTGEFYDVAAPGYNILSCSLEAGKVAYMMGTSQASPLVAACAALYLQEYPHSTVEELYEALRKSPVKKVKQNSVTVPNATYRFKALEADLLLEYGKVDPDLKLNINTNVTKDETLGYIWGLDEGFTDINKYVSLKEGTGTLEYIPAECGIGTGSILNIYDIYGDLYKTYTIIVFGDVNGDATVDGQDAVLISCIMNFPDLFSESQKFAADVDFDSMVTERDYEITSDSAILLDFVFQIR